MDARGRRVAEQAKRQAWTALALVTPATLFWISTIIAAVLHSDVLTRPLTRTLLLLDFWFVVGALILMPLAGALLAAFNLRRGHFRISLAAMVLGFTESGLAILMNTSPPSVH